MGRGPSDGKGAKGGKGGKGGKGAKGGGRLPSRYQPYPPSRYGDQSLPPRRGDDYRREPPAPRQPPPPRSTSYDSRRESGGKGRKGGAPPSPQQQHRPQPERRGPPAAQAPVAQQKAPSRGQSVPFFPFEDKYRSSQQMRVRCGAHFRPLPEASLYTSYVSSIPTGSAAFLKDDAKRAVQKCVISKEISSVEDESAIEAMFKEKVEEGESAIRVNVLLLFPDFASQRMKMAGAVSLDPSRTAHPAVAFGGVVTDGPFKTHILPQLVELLKAQTGIDFSNVKVWRKLCKITSESADALSSATVIPELTAEALEGQLGAEGQLELKRVELRKENKEVIRTVTTEEKLEEGTEDHVEGETEEDRLERLAAAKKTVEHVHEEEKVTVTQRQLLQPVSIDISHLPLRREDTRRRPTADNPVATSVVEELHHVFYILEELIRRDSISYLLNFLSSKSALQEKATKEMADNATSEKDLITAVKSLESDRDAEYSKKVGEIQAAWDNDDEGETMDEIQEKEAERTKEREALKSEIFTRVADEVAALRAKRKTEQRRLVCDTDKPALFALQVFDPATVITKFSKVDRKVLLQAVGAANPSFAPWETEAALSEVRREQPCHDLATIKRATYVIARDADEEGDVEMGGADSADPQEDIDFADEDGAAEAMQVDAEMDSSSNKYAAMSYKELQALCKARKLPATGRASVLAERLQEAD